MSELFNVSCQQVKSVLSAYMDHELGHNEILAVSRHLSECNGCNAEFEKMKSLSALIKSKCNIPSEENIYANVMSRLAREN